MAVHQQLHEDGGHLLGNFKNYYAFHPVEQRLKLFPQNFFVNLHESLGFPRELFLLDVGCNEGDLSIAIYFQAKDELATAARECVVKMLGTDIDTVLISRAIEKSEYVKADVHFIAMDFMDQVSIGKLRSYLEQYGAMSFDFISLFSITMWIHVNFGWDGLSRFLKQSLDLTRAYLLVEPQPRKCYRSARTRCRRQKLTPPKFLEQSFLEDTSKSESTDEIVRQMLQSNCHDGNVNERDIKSTIDVSNEILNNEEISTALRCDSWGTEDWGRSLLLFEKSR